MLTLQSGGVSAKLLHLISICRNKLPEETKLDAETCRTNKTPIPEAHNGSLYMGIEWTSHKFIPVDALGDFSACPVHSVDKSPC